MIGPYVWGPVAEFIDRDDELAVLERWWSSSERMGMNLYGPRRCGKSWLVRRLAHGKPSIVLVGHRSTPGAQLESFAERLGELLGIRPSLPDLPSLFRVLYRAAKDRKVLAVIDEFPYLLPGTEVENERELTAIQAVMEEERDSSKLKLILCGSFVGQMEALQAERGPLHGRLVPLQLQALTFREARLFLDRRDPIEQFERFSIAGGMPRYLAALRDRGPLPDVVCRHLLDRNAALWDEGRTILEQELREPKVYFAVLQALASGDKEANEVAQAVRSDSQRVSRYLNVLEAMRVVERRLPLGSPVTSRTGHWHLRDQFLRFWFRFLFPYQDDLEAGLDPRELWSTEVAPVFNDHVAAEFEDYCRTWTRRHHGDEATRVGAWWGPALNEHRKTGARYNEEIDIVGMSRNRVTLLGEARWRNTKTDADLLDAIDRYKLPALRQSGLKVVDQPRILLFSRSGYSARLTHAAAQRDDVTVVDVQAALRD